MALFILSACGGGPTSPGQPPPPPVVNAAPVIDSLTVSAPRVEVGASVTVTAAVHDAETPADRLEYSWSADAGAISGSQASVTYAPADEPATPVDRTITLTVIERYQSGTATLENRTTGTVSIRIHNSPRELADMSLRFLNMFGNSSIPPDACVSEFAASCAGGRSDELADITANRRDFTILAATFTPTSASISADGLRATVHTFGRVRALIISKPPDCVPVHPGDCDPGHIGDAVGDFWTTDVYENGRWWICQSHFTSSDVLSPAARAFVGHRLTYRQD